MLKEILKIFLRQTPRKCLVTQKTLWTLPKISPHPDEA